MLFDEYAMVGAVVAVILTICALFALEKAKELEGALMFVVPVVGCVAGALWPVVFIVGFFAFICYTLTTCVKKISNRGK